MCTKHRTLRAADSVIVAVHGIGDHTPEDLLGNADGCVASVFGGRASLDNRRRTDDSSPPTAEREET